MAYVNQLLSDAKQIKNYATGVLENISCLPSVLGNILGANILGEFTTIALEGIKGNFIAIADNISMQVQNVIGSFTNKLTEISQLANNITKTVCGVESLITGIVRDAKDLASDMFDGFNQSERCQYVGAQIGACIRAKVYNKLSTQLQRNIVNSDIYNDLAFGKISQLESLSKKSDDLISSIDVPGISDNFLKAEAERVNRARIQLGRVNNLTIYGTEGSQQGRNTFRNYNFRYRPYTNYQSIPVRQTPVQAE
jgi:hypothetical protein